MHNNKSFSRRATIRTIYPFTQTERISRRIEDGVIDYWHLIIPTGDSQIITIGEGGSSIFPIPTVRRMRRLETTPETAIRRKFPDLNTEGCRTLPNGFVIINPFSVTPNYPVLKSFHYGVVLPNHADTSAVVVKNYGKTIPTIARNPSEWLRELDNGPTIHHLVAASAILSFFLEKYAHDQ